MINLLQTTYVNPGIVSAESSLCATIHWGSAWVFWFVHSHPFFSHFISIIKHWRFEVKRFMIWSLPYVFHIPFPLLNTGGLRWDVLWFGRSHFVSFTFHLKLPIIKHWRLEVEFFLICSFRCRLFTLQYLLLNTGGSLRENASSIALGCVGTLDFRAPGL